MGDYDRSALRISFEYAKAPTYQVVNANGAFGGFTAHNELFINFFFEHAKLPEVDIHDVVGDGLGPPIVADAKNIKKFSRQLQVGVVMHVDNARSLVQWIQRQIDTYDERKEGTQNE